MVDFTFNVLEGVAVDTSEEGAAISVAADAEIDNVDDEVEVIGNLDEDDNNEVDDDKDFDEDEENVTEEDADKEEEDGIVDKNDDAGEYDEDLTNIDVIDVSDEATLFVKIELLFVNAEFVLEDWLFVWWVVWVDEDEIVEEDVDDAELGEVVFEIANVLFIDDILDVNDVELEGWVTVIVGLIEEILDIAKGISAVVVSTSDGYCSSSTA